jgi:hypothetical protein
MEHLESLITSRAYEVINSLLKFFPYLSTVELYGLFDVDQVVSDRRLNFSVSLEGGYTLVVSERYDYQEYQLVALYNYSLLSSTKEFIVSYDNSPHHSHLTNFPHHKHLYPRSQYRPGDFSGKLADALNEIKWVIERIS